MSVTAAGVYIHIPFCRSRCNYCDFNTYAGLDHLIDAHVGALCAEIERFDPFRVPRDAPAGENARGSASSGVCSRDDNASRPRALTIYIGGGTPSILGSEQLARILASCRARFDVAEDAEITVEANPGTVSLDGVRALRRRGVNRLSLGVQSLDDALLRSVGRAHTAQEARAACAAARAAGFDNLSLDFIYGLPEQSVAHWRETLTQALALQPQHLSLYALTLEEGTPLAQRVAAGAVALPDDDTVADMYALAEDVLEQAGFLHYEISNWASSAATVARHNMLYWQRRPYYGFGAGAHSFDGARRYANVAHPRDYIARLLAGQSPVAECETVTPAAARSETMFLGLRLLVQGVSEREFLAAHQQPLAVFASQIDELIAQGLLERCGDAVRLTRRGRLLSNQVFIQFLS